MRGHASSAGEYTAFEAFTLALESNDWKGYEDFKGFSLAAIGEVTALIAEAADAEATGAPVVDGVSQCGRTTEQTSRR